MRIFGKASKSYPQNSELRGHCGADSRAIRAKLSANEIARNFKKAAKGAEAKDQILLNFTAHFAASGTLCPPAASAFCSQNGSGIAQFMRRYAHESG
ncbi:MAG: hypothetical protein D8H92_09665 [Campylobacter sp.]|nr:MAG: hypothetical protein D8H92_09665 [Campylobacter sp.]